MKRILFLVSMTVVVLLAVSGCGGTQAPQPKSFPVLRNDLEGGHLVRTHDLAEKFSFVTDYSTSYKTDDWKITDSKSLRMAAHIEPTVGAEGVEVLIEHVHVDIALAAYSQEVDGWTQDSMDDSFHGTAQSGFWITRNYEYEEIFAIEGFSKELIDGWGFFTGSFGVISISEKRLTEHNLISAGKVYGNKVQVVYDLLVKYPGEPYYHTKSVIDEFLIPVGKQGQEILRKATS